MKLALLALTLLTLPASATEIRISAAALERTLNQQLFKGPEHRFYLKGSDQTSCFVYATDPKVSFKDDRVLVHVKTRAKLGGTFKGACVGFGLAPEVDVSLEPEAEGETIGFRDPRIEKLSESRELNFLLEPFLARKLPQQMKVNAADLIRNALSKSQEVTGYTIALGNLRVHSMQVAGDTMTVDFDGTLSVK